jgi:Domain of unknown function (DUF4382)
MRMTKSLITLGTLFLLAVTFGCGGSGGGSSNGSSTGTVSLSMTDAKPMLPENVTNCFVTIGEVLVHSSGGGWQTLPMIQTPYTIDLLQFTDGFSTEFVPPVKLEKGKYTQIRLSVTNAVLRFDNGGTTEDVTATIPSENLKTDKNFDFDVAEGSAIDITVDFDLSKSIVVEGPSGSPSYKLKPVLHLVTTTEAATIQGSILNTSIPNGNGYVIISVVALSNNEEYTRVRVDKNTTTGATKTDYTIFWLVPKQDYRVYIDYDPETEIPQAFDNDKPVYATDVEPGETATVNFP